MMQRSCRPGACLLLALVTSGAPLAALHAQGAPPAPDAATARELALRTLRYQREDEDWRWLASGARQPDRWDAVKLLHAGGSARLSLGADLRAWAEHIDHENWGASAVQHNDDVLTRALLHADLRGASRWRAFAQLKAIDIQGRTGGPRPSIDRNRLDLHQAFAEVDLSSGGTTRTLRIGRQELAFGKSRLISTRDGAINARQSEDGVRAILRRGPWRVDVFAVRVVASQPGTFDDNKRGQPYWSGVYATRTRSAQAGIDLYALGFDSPRTAYFSGAADEHRRTAGGRWWGRSGSWDHEIEALYQGGRFGALDINAWSVATESGYTASSLPATPRFSLATTLNSGDRSAGDHQLNTFRPLQSRMPLGTLPALGAANLIGAQLAASINPWPTLKVTLRNTWLWRQSAADGLYSGGVAPLRAGTRSQPRRVGDHLELELEVNPTRHARFGFVASHLTAGDFIRATPGAADIAYVAASAAYRL